MKYVGLSVPVKDSLVQFYPQTSQFIIQSARSSNAGSQYFASHISRLVNGGFVPLFKQICIKNYGDGQFSNLIYAICL